MAARGGAAERGRRVARTAVEAVGYALVVTATATVLAFVVAIATGLGVAGTKLFLFLAGLVLMGMAVFRLWPTEPTAGADVTVRGSGNRPADTVGRTRIEGATAALPPLRWMRTPRRRLSPPVKLLLASVFVLAASFLLEVLFAVE